MLLESKHGAVRSAAYMAAQELQIGTLWSHATDLYCANIISRQFAKFRIQVPFFFFLKKQGFINQFLHNRRVDITRFIILQ